MRRLTSIAMIIAASAVLAGFTAAAQMAPKTPKERDALIAIQNAPDADTRIKRIDEMLANFADTAFKPVLLDMAVDAAQEKNDYPLTIAWAERDLESSPKSYAAMLAIATSTAASTKEFDLDKNEKLAKAEKYANQALETLKTAEKPPQFPEDKWPMVKNSYEGKAHAALAMIALARKKYDDAIAEFKTASDLAPDPVLTVRMGDAYLKAGKYDDAISTFDKAMAMPDTTPQVKRFAQNEKNIALTKKNGAGGTPAAAAPPAPATAAPSTPPATAPTGGATTK